MVEWDSLSSVSVLECSNVFNCRMAHTDIGICISSYYDHIVFLTQSAPVVNIIFVYSSAVRNHLMIQQLLGLCPLLLHAGNPHSHDSDRILISMTSEIVHFNAKQILAMTSTVTLSPFPSFAIVELERPVCFARSPLESFLSNRVFHRGSNEIS